jgi:hypothetical protein
MQSILSLLCGAVLVGLVYGLSLLPSATLARSDDIELLDDDQTSADSDDAEAPPDAQRDAGERDAG